MMMDQMILSELQTANAPLKNLQEMALLVVTCISQYADCMMQDLLLYERLAS